jgi:dTDP-4-dehydrorhamnose reductase
MPPSILITGSTGQVGHELQKLFPQAQAPTRKELDLTNPESIRTYLRETKPGWIVNPAAYTAVDQAESEPDLAYAINRDAVRILAEEARRIGARLIHFSTDYVFDGQSNRPYVETDPTNPLGVYGASKLAGEQALHASGAEAIVLRTSWVYGATGKNFLRTILRLAAEKPELRIVSDQFGAPTWSRDLARTVHHVIHTTAHVVPGETYHVTSAGQTTWADFATEILRQSTLKGPAKIIPIPSSEYPTPAARPRNSRLNCTKLTQTFGVTLPDWKTSLTQVMAELA